MKFRQALFWDTNPKKINAKKHARYIIERVLEYGNDKEVRWVWKSYDKSLLKRVVSYSKYLTPRSRNFWKLILKNMYNI